MLFQPTTHSTADYIGLTGAFHGKTFGSLSGTSKAVFRKPFVGACNNQ